jgi:hypothetical protein
MTGQRVNKHFGHDFGRRRPAHLAIPFIIRCQSTHLYNILTAMNRALVV